MFAPRRARWHLPRASLDNFRQLGAFLECTKVGRKARTSTGSSQAMACSQLFSRHPQ